MSDSKKQAHGRDSATVRIAIFRNKRKNKDTSPSHRIIFSEKGSSDSILVGSLWENEKQTDDGSSYTYFSGNLNVDKVLDAQRRTVYNAPPVITKPNGQVKSADEEVVTVDRETYETMANAEKLAELVQTVESLLAAAGPGHGPKDEAIDTPDVEEDDPENAPS